MARPISFCRGHFHCSLERTFCSILEEASMPRPGWGNGLHDLCIIPRLGYTFKRKFCFSKNQQQNYVWAYCDNQYWNEWSLKGLGCYKCHQLLSKKQLYIPSVPLKLNRLLCSECTFYVCEPDNVEGDVAISYDESSERLKPWFKLVPGGVRPHDETLHQRTQAWNTALLVVASMG